MRGGKESFTQAEMPFLHRGTTMVPLCMVSEKMGAVVAYLPHPTTPVISITSKAGKTASQ